MPGITGTETAQLGQRRSSPVQARQASSATNSSIDITLLGQKIPIRTSEKDPELVAEVISLVSLLLKNAERRLQGQGKAGVAHQVVLLALLELAQDYVKAKRRTASYRREVQGKAIRLMEIVQETLK